MKRLIKRLTALPDGLMKQAEAAAASAAAHAAEIARGLVPVDTGELKGSISSSPAPGGAVMTASVPHAAMVEYGTSKMPPQPFMLPAAHASADVFFKSIENSSVLKDR